MGINQSIPNCAANWSCLRGNSFGITSAVVFLHGPNDGIYSVTGYVSHDLATVSPGDGVDAAVGAQGIFQFMRSSLCFRAYNDSLYNIWEASGINFNDVSVRLVDWLCG